MPNINHMSLQKGIEISIPYAKRSTFSKVVKINFVKDSVFTAID